jgi:hypothetical protein
MPNEALRLIGLIDERQLDASSFATGAVLRAWCALAWGDRARARGELGRVTRPSANEASERSLAAIELLLEAIDGDPTVAAERAEAELASDPEGGLRRTLRSAQAHAWAATGRRAEALALLCELAAEASSDDPKLLARLIRHGGAASPLAASLLAADVGAYR